MKKRTHIIVSFLITVAAGLVIWGCSNKENGPNKDSEIAATVAAANTGEITIAQLAQTKASNPEVKAFATRMVTEYTMTQQRQAALFSRLGIIPTDNSTSKQFQDDARAMLAMLTMQPATAFDLAFLDGQLTLQRKVLLTLDMNLIPYVQNNELRTDLGQMRGDIAMHLQSAQALRAKLGAAVDGGSGGTDGGTDGGATDGGEGTDGGAADAGTPDGGSPDGATVIRR